MTRSSATAAAGAGAGAGTRMQAGAAEDLSSSLGDLGARHAWRGTVTAAALNGVGMPFEILLGREIEAMPWWPPLMSSAVGVSLVALLLWRRPRITVRLASTAFLVNVAAILVCLWITSGHYASASELWIPFQANKLGALAVAMLAPGLAAGLTAIGGFVGMALARFLVFDPVIQQRLPIGEPWVILFYGLFAGVLAIYRLRAYELERHRARVHAEAVMVERFARTFRAVRDYANTPLQTVELCAALIRARDPRHVPVLDRMDRAVSRLFELSRVFTAWETDVVWRPHDVSFASSPLILSRAAARAARSQRESVARLRRSSRVGGCLRRARPSR